MVPTHDLVPELLTAIRDEMRGMRSGLTEVRDELRGVREEQAGMRGDLTAMREDLNALGRRQIEAELRFGTAITELQGATRELITETKKLHERIDHVFLGPMGESLRDVVVRVERLEAKVG